MDEPVRGASFDPRPTVSDALADVGIVFSTSPRRVRIAATVSFVCLAVWLAGWWRPFDVTLLATSFATCFAGFIGFGALILAAASAERVQWARFLAFLIGALGILALIPITAVVVLLSFRSPSETEVGVPDTDLAVVKVGSSNDHVNQLVLRGHFGPLPRQRTFASLGTCRATIIPQGPRQVKVIATETSEGCGVLGRGGTYVVTVEPDGWSTSIQHLP